VTNGVSNIQSVRGGQGGNTLTGNSQGNILVGGAGSNVIQGGNGRSILIGGTGTDQVTGGSADDIVIAGTVTYATNGDWTALAVIFVEWQSADPYLTRINKIKNLGVGPNNQYKLVWGNTVLDNDMAPATLTGGAGTDWFFAKIANGGVLDIITDLNAPTERVD
jgi:Ca2+-binding RTX toxin-like protein